MSSEPLHIWFPSLRMLFLHKPPGKSLLILEGSTQIEILQVSTLTPVPPGLLAFLMCPVNHSLLMVEDGLLTSIPLLKMTQASQSPVVSFSRLIHPVLSARMQTTYGVPPCSRSLPVTSICAVMKSRPLTTLYH